MTAPLRAAGAANGRKAARILEIGPGTGAVTREIAAAMGPHDELDCYEVNTRFARYLEDEIRRDPAFAPVAERVRVHNRPAQELAATEPFDFVICSAPLNNFDADTIAAILDTALAALTAEGRMTFFEYVVLPTVKRSLSGAATRDRLTRALAAKHARLASHGRGSTLVLRNVPPARVHELVAGNG